MTRPFSLQSVLELMQTRSEEATQRLAGLIAAERNAREKFAMLLEYRDEYTARYRQAVQNGLGQPEWRNYQEFLSRLDEAIKQQMELVSAQESHTAAGQEDWKRQRAKMKALDALSERHRASEARLEIRQEQKAQDEFAAHRKDNEQES